MLRQWFNRAIVLAISQQGICLRDKQGNCEMLTSIEADIKSLAANDANIKNTPFKQIVDALSKKQKILKNQHVKIILSNHLVRFCVVPWHDKVVSLGDWQAIAQQVFRQQFGAVASEWRIAISFAKYGETMLAAAMDDSLYIQLENCAKQFGFTIDSIEPLLAALLNQTAFNPAQPYSWALIAEPQRVLLCQFNQQYQWQNLIVESPPAGREYQRADLLVKRNLMAIDAAEQPQKIATFVSSALNRVWQDNIGSKLKLITQSNFAQAHPIWLANIGAVSPKSQMLSFNFLNKTTLNNITLKNITLKNITLSIINRKASFGGMLLLASASLLAVFTSVHILQIKADYALLQQQNKLSQSIDIKAQQSQYVNTDYVNQVKSATTMQQQLNTPWMPMLAALEVVKSQNPAVLITTISPNNNQAEIKLSGEANTFAQITQFLNHLRANPTFSDAVLVSQHLEQEVDMPNQAPIVVFEVAIGWRL